MILPVGEEGKYTDDSNYTYRPEPSTEAYETDEFGSIIEPATEADDDGNYDKERAGRRHRHTTDSRSADCRDPRAPDVLI